MKSIYVVMGLFCCLCLSCGNSKQENRPLESQPAAVAEDTIDVWEDGILCSRVYHVKDDGIDSAYELTYKNESGRDTTVTVFEKPDSIKVDNIVYIRE